MKCQLCDYSVPVALQRHHLRPKSNGGSSAPKNLIVVCANCHAVLSSVMGKLNGALPSGREVRMMATKLRRFAQLVQTYEHQGSLTRISVHAGRRHGLANKGHYSPPAHPRPQQLFAGLMVVLAALGLRRAGG